MPYKDDEIQKEFEKQVKRPKLPIDIGAGRRHLKLLESFERLLNNCANEREFADRIIEDFQIIYGSRRYVAALEAYRAYRAGLR
jgi:hypothetical protein